MTALDDHLAGLAGGGWLIALAVALLLGLRHATDPDHLTAISMLVADEGPESGRRAGRLGLAWGLGHAMTLFGFGLPIVLFGAYLPEAAQRAAEVAVGAMIVGLAIRLLLGCGCHVAARRGGALGRSGRAAFAIGLVHGAGGSAGVGLLLIGSVSQDRMAAALALVVLAGGAAVSMTALSCAFGSALASRPARLRSAPAVHGLGVAGMLFGTWYALAALGAA